MPTTQPFIHTPRAAEVRPIQGSTTQRYFCDADGERDVILRSATHDRIAEFGVMRFADRDVADVEAEVRNGSGYASILARLGPIELRDLAQRLLDAAHDIETNPAADLVAAHEAAEAVPA